MDLERSIELGAAVGIAVLGADSFHKYLPSVSDIRKAGPNDKDIRADVHAGELLAGITVLTVSSLVAAVSGKASPIYIGAISFMAMAATYEALLRAPADAIKG